MLKRDCGKNAGENTYETETGTEKLWQQRKKRKKRKKTEKNETAQLNITSRQNDAFPLEKSIQNWNIFFFFFLQWFISENSVGLLHSSIFREKRKI